MLEFPHLAGLTCEYCKEWMVDLETGKVMERSRKPQRRPSGAPTPCRKCPYESPELAPTKKLTKANWQTLELFVRNRATFGRLLNEREANDTLLHRNFGVIDTMLRQWENTQTAELLGNMLAVGVGGGMASGGIAGGGRHGK